MMEMSGGKLFQIWGSEKSGKRATWLVLEKGTWIS